MCRYIYIYYIIWYVNICKQDAKSTNIKEVRIIHTTKNYLISSFTIKWPRIAIYFVI